MPYCSHCGKLAQGGRYCAFCGTPMAPDAVAEAGAKIRRHRWERRLAAAAIGLLLAISAGLIVGRSRPAGQIREIPAGESRTGESSAAPQEQSPSVPTEGAPPTENGDEGLRAEPQPNRPQEEQRQPENPQGYPKEPERHQEPQLPPASADISPGSDRYPGSQPVEVQNANLPDIGIPVATETYATSDSLMSVIAYYRQRYPDAELTQVNGQNVLAVNRPGAAKVIAVGTAGSETRIAIVQQRH